MLAVPMTRENPIVLLTRPLAASERFAKDLQGLDVRVVISPVQSIEAMDFDVPHALKGAIFTSRNGVRAVEGKPIPCWCVGDVTMQAAIKKGWQACSASGDAEALFRRILADRPEGPLVHFRGAYARGNLATRLQAEGIDVQEVVAYRQVSEMLNHDAKSALNRENPIILPLFSPRSAAQVVQQGPFPAPICVVAMSDAVAGEATALSPSQLVIADAPNAASMVAAIKQMAKGL